MAKSDTGQNAGQDLSVLVVNDLPKARPFIFQLAPKEDAMDQTAEALGILGVRKLRFSGEIEFNAHGEVVVTADLGVTVTQECVVTLEPVRTRIDAPVVRRFSPDMPDVSEDHQLLEDEDENLEPLGDEIDLRGIMVEAIALNLPDFPRVEGAELKQRTFAAPGVTPMEDEDAKPFAGLAALKAELENKS